MTRRLIKGFFDTIPAELDESARVDGATPAQVFWGVVLPLATPVLAVVGLFSFIATLNEFAIISALIQTKDNYTLPLGLRGFIDQQYGQTLGPVRRRRRAHGDPGRDPVPVPAAVHRLRAHAGLGQGMSTAADPVSPARPSRTTTAPTLRAERPDELGDEVTVRLACRARRAERRSAPRPERGAAGRRAR